MSFWEGQLLTYFPTFFEKFDPMDLGTEIGRWSTLIPSPTPTPTPQKSKIWEFGRFLKQILKVLNNPPPPPQPYPVL